MKLKLKLRTYLFLIKKEGYGSSHYLAFKLMISNPSYVSELPGSLVKIKILVLLSEFLIQ